MSDTADEAEFHARQLLNKSRTYPLREQMREFVDDHEDVPAFKQLRERVAEGEDLSDVVAQERAERL